MNQHDQPTSVVRFALAIGDHRSEAASSAVRLLAPEQFGRKEAGLVRDGTWSAPFEAMA